jgi:hypothetical protein
MKKLLLFSITLLLFFSVQASEFTGIVRYARYTSFDTTYYNIFVGEIWMRIEVSDGRHDVQEVYLFNHVENKGVMLSPQRKQYMDLVLPLFAANSNANDFSFKKTTNFRIINMFKCYQWRVRNEKLATEVEYWVISYDYPFFCELNYFNGKVGYLSSFFCYIPKNEDRIPVEATEYNLFREKKSQLKLLEIRRLQPNASLFEIPKNYVKVN